MRKPTILIIEDTETTLSLLRSYLSADFTVHTAVEMQEANRLISFVEFDYILSDFNLPDGNGLLILKTLRKNGKKARFILMHAGSCLTADEVMTAGADGFLSKPFSRKTLIDLLHPSTS